MSIWSCFVIFQEFPLLNFFSIHAMGYQLLRRLLQTRNSKKDARYRCPDLLTSLLSSSTTASSKSTLLNNVP